MWEEAGRAPSLWTLAGAAPQDAPGWATCFSHSRSLSAHNHSGASSTTQGTTAAALIYAGQVGQQMQTSCVPAKGALLRGIPGVSYANASTYIAGTAGQLTRWGLYYLACCQALHLLPCQSFCSSGGRGKESRQTLRCLGEPGDWGVPQLLCSQVFSCLPI